MSVSPLISVITPFHNTAPYLEAAIKSVLGQSLADFEYLLVDNASTDGSLEIARKYAAIEPRIRLIQNEAFLGQVENYNGALERISSSSAFVKIVQADDTIFPDCLRLMVETAQRDDRIGIVTSFYLKGSTPMGSGVSHDAWRASGRDVLRAIMIGNAFPLGSPTTVLYRANLVRSRRPFYTVGRYHEDTEAACEILLHHDLGFVPQILSFLRTDNISITSATRRFNPVPLDHLIILERYGRQVLSEAEFERQSTLEWRAYLGFLGASVLARRGPDFWRYHRGGLATIGRTLTTRSLLLPTSKQALRLVSSPLTGIRDSWALLREQRGK
jgi:glycosyltransferase involved in cell wall biosynthesis